MREMELRGERCRVCLARENMEEDGRGMGGNSLPLFGISSFRTAQSSMASQCTEWPKCPDTGRPHLKSRHGDRTASPRSCHAGTLRATLTPRTPQVPGNGDLGSASCDVSRPRTNSVHDTHPIHDGRQIAARPPIEAGPPTAVETHQLAGQGRHLTREVDAAYKAFVSPQRVRPQARESLGFCISSFSFSSLDWRRDLMEFQNAERAGTFGFCNCPAQTSPLGPA